MIRPTIDTADRLRATDTLTVDGRRVLVLAVTSDPTATRPARMAVSVCDPDGSLSDLHDTRTVHVDAGDTVTYWPHSMHLADVTGRRPGM